MKLSTTGSRHDEAGCAMLIIWAVIAFSVCEFTHKYGFWGDVVGVVICAVLLGIGMLFVANKYPIKKDKND